MLWKKLSSVLGEGISPPFINSIFFTPVSNVDSGDQYILSWTTTNAIAVTYDITANIGGNITPIANGTGGVDGNTIITALNTYWSMTANIVAEGNPGASPLFAYATANVFVSTVYTSALYPYVFGDELTVGLPSISGGYMFSSIQEEVDIGLPSIVSGNLVATINYVTYQDYPPEEIDVGLPSIISGNLATTINFVTYQDYPPEEIDVGLPTIISGNLAVTINYVTYQDYPPEEIDVGLPTIVSGTLI
jgi:phage terminase large subunit-like protein